MTSMQSWLPAATQLNEVEQGNTLVGPPVANAAVVKPGETDFDALAAQNAAVQQLPIGPEESGAPTSPLTYSAFQTSVLGDAPVAANPAAFDKVLSDSRALSKEQRATETQDLQALGATAANEKNAAIAVGNAEIAKAESQVPGKEQLAVAAENYEGTVKKLNDQARFEVDNQTRRVRVAADAAQAFQFKDFWATRNTAGTIMGIIAQALGGGLNALANNPGGPTMLDKVIARDWEQQQAKYGQLQQNLGNETGLLKELRTTLKDRNEQAQAFYIASTAKIQAQLEAAAAKSSSPVVKANAEKAIAELQSRVAERMQKYDSESFKNRIVELNQQANITNMKQQLVNGMADVHFRNQAKEEKENATQGTSVGGIDTSNLSKLSARQRIGVQERISLINGAMDDIEKYENEISNFPSTNTSKIAAIKNSLPKALGIGAGGLSEYTQKLEGQRIPGAYEVIAGRAYPPNAAKFAQLKEDLRRAMRDIVTGNNLSALPGSRWEESSAPVVSSNVSQPQPLTAAQMKAMAKQSRAK